MPPETRWHITWLKVEHWLQPKAYIPFSADVIFLDNQSIRCLKVCFYMGFPCFVLIYNAQSPLVVPHINKTLPKQKERRRARSVISILPQDHRKVNKKTWFNVSHVNALLGSFAPAVVVVIVGRPEMRHKIFRCHFGIKRHCTAPFRLTWLLLTNFVWCPPSFRP